MTDLDYTIYARTELISIPQDEPIPEGYWVTDFSWNVQIEELVRWASDHPGNFRFRAIAFEPVDVNKKENN
jgi:hypothetical protein